MNFLFQRRLNPAEVVEHIIQNMPEKELAILNSCKECNFELALWKQMYRQNLIFRFKTWKKAQEAFQYSVEVVSWHCSNPVTENQLEVYCQYLVALFFIKKKED